MKKIKSLLIVLFVGACVMSSCSLNDTSVEAQKSGSSGRTLEIMLLATEKVNIKVVRLFAYLHDHKRINDGWDLEHGQRAAENLDNIRRTLLAGLTDDEFGMLRRACMEHTTTQRTGIPTIDACFDADRLDLPRVGYRPDPIRMASELGALYAKHNVVANDCSICYDIVERIKDNM